MAVPICAGAPSWKRAAGRRLPAGQGPGRYDAHMKERGVLVKNVAGLHPLLANCLRLTVGTPEENALMIDALRASLR